MSQVCIEININGDTVASYDAVAAPRKGERLSALFRVMPGCEHMWNDDCHVEISGTVASVSWYIRKTHGEGTLQTTVFALVELTPDEVT